MNTVEEIEFYSDDEHDSQQEQDSQEPPRKKRRTRSPAWNFFTRGNNTATCHICNIVLPTINTTVLRRHLDSFHKDANNTTEITILSLEERILNWVIFSLVPLHCIDNDSFQALFSEPVVSRRTMKIRIEQKFEQAKQRLIKFLGQSLSNVSFTTDLWSSNYKDYAGVTIHFKDVNYQLHHSVIAVRRVLSHRGKEIAEVFVNVWDEFKVANKIGHITTDNQSNNDTFCEELEIY